MKNHKYIELITNVLLFAGIIFPAIGFVGVILMWKYLKWSRLVKMIITIPYIVVFLLAIFVIVYLFFFRPYQMKGVSMEPALSDSAYVATQVFRGDFQVKRGDIVVVKTANSSALFIKRAIGLPGETLKIEGGSVFIYGSKLEEPYLAMDTKTNIFADFYMQEGQEIVIPDNFYFLLGDNRARSSDSRDWGNLPKEYILSKVLFCYFQCK